MIYKVLKGKSGFVMVEGMITCALLMLLWYFIIQCAVQVCMIESRLEEKVYAFSIATTVIDKLKNGIYPLVYSVVTDGIYLITISCVNCQFPESLVSVNVKVSSYNTELLCIKTLLIKK